MASLKVKFRPSSVPHNPGSIYYQVIHNRIPRQISTKYHVYPTEWDSQRESLIIRAKSTRRHILLSFREHMRHDIEQLSNIIRRLDNGKIEYQANDIVLEFQRYISKGYLFNFMEHTITKLKALGKVRTSETYTATLNCFKRFTNNEDILLESLTSELMEKYEVWQRERGLTSNTISFYNRILRAVYNRAVEEGIIKNCHPFSRVYTGIDKTKKRALPITIIKKIKTLDLSSTPCLDYARDMFMLSFMLRGMSFVDMAFLKKSDLIDGFITYRRRKTSQRITVEWTEEMQHILDKYPDTANQYLLPIIRGIEVDEHRTYSKVSHNINHNLKSIAKMIGLTVPLTLYVARHSWATAAQSKGIPLSIISEGMGHDSESTTRIYLAHLSTSAVDKANAIILKSLR